MPTMIQRLPAAKSASQRPFSFLPEKRQVPQSRKTADQSTLSWFMRREYSLVPPQGNEHLED